MTQVAYIYFPNITIGPPLQRHTHTNPWKCVSHTSGACTLGRASDPDGGVAFHVPGRREGRHARRYEAPLHVSRCRDARRSLARGGKLHQITRHMLGLFTGRPGARAWRRVLSEGATRPGADYDLVEEALAQVTGEPVAG